MEHIKLISTVFLSIFLISFSSYAECNCKNFYSHAPIGVMGDHIHSTGESMLSYRHMFMSMDGNKNGTSSISSQEVLNDFMITPVDMDMHMHMLGGMFAVRDWLTLMLMVPYTELSMNHLTRNGMRFKTRSNGLGDIKINGLIRIYENKNHKIHLNDGISLPSGEIDARDDTPAASNVKLPYPMQLGSGTVDLLPGITYLGKNDLFAWGAQISGTIRLGENDNNYTLGNRFESTTWSTYSISDSTSASLRLNWQSWGNIDGLDPDLNPMLVSTADPSKRGGDRLDVGFGLNLYIPSGVLRSSKLALEFLLPVHEDLNGPQLETDWTSVLGWQVAF